MWLQRALAVIGAGVILFAATAPLVVNGKGKVVNLSADRAERRQRRHARRSDAGADRRGGNPPCATGVIIETLAVDESAGTSAFADDGFELTIVH